MGKNDKKEQVEQQTSYFRISSGIKFVGENKYASRINEMRQQTGKAPSEFSSQVDKEFGLSGVSFWPEKGVYMISANSAEEAKKIIESKKAEYEKAFGLKIDLKKLEIIS
jgi:hypothetical protein